MAQRKKYDCGPHKEHCPHEGSKILFELPERQFACVVRMINSCETKKLGPLLAAFAAKLDELGVRQNGRKAVSGVPEGSDQVDIGSVIAWCNRICSHQPDAIKQLVALHATAYVRLR